MPAGLAFVYHTAGDDISNEMYKESCAKQAVPGKGIKQRSQETE